MPATAYLARLRELRGELADTQAALLKAGQPIQLETFKCPNCGGDLVKRPTRPEKALVKFPASTKRVRKDHEACRQVA